MRHLIRRALQRAGYDLVPYPSPPAPWPRDLTPGERQILETIQPFTMTGTDRQVGLLRAVQHLVQAQVPGCFVECGVWRGGSSMAIALTLRQLGVSDRDLYLYDTYTGMTPPTEVDRSPEGLPAEVLLTANADMRCIADEDDVRRNLALTGYPAARVHFVAGKVEETLPAHAPREPIALLRLDTDWYESTKHELETLYPRLVSGGILLVDDYGHWAGSKKAVDEYFAGRPIYLHRVDFSGRLLIKP